jgi:hypothetical protein
MAAVSAHARPAVAAVAAPSASAGRTDAVLGVAGTAGTAELSFASETAVAAVSAVTSIARDESHIGECDLGVPDPKRDRYAAAASTKAMLSWKTAATARTTARRCARRAPFARASASAPLALETVEALSASAGFISHGIERVRR